MPGHAIEYTKGKVVDSYTGNSISRAFVTLGNDVSQTDEKDVFIISSRGNKVAVREWGYLRTEQAITEPLEIRLIPFKPKALYLSFYGIWERSLKEPALRLIEDTELNALVIDVKGDMGRIVYESSIPLASDIGAQKMILVKDIRGLIKSLKERGIFTIARIVVFKDDLLASARHDLAVKTKSGGVWYDRENLEWVDPFEREVWDYNINIAVEAAQYGFDEIQFDYVRFPDVVGLKFSMENTEENRVNFISGSNRMHNIKLRRALPTRFIALVTH
jgi:hypothetical protein